MFLEGKSLAEKKSVVKACQGEEEKIIRFGDANMSKKATQHVEKVSVVSWN